MRKILIATTNQGKFEEFKIEFADLPFTLVSLTTFKKRPTEPEETGRTTEENALLKARYYAEKTGLLTLAEDTGFFVDALQGEPGVQAKRFGISAKERNIRVLNLLRGVPAAQRGAEFQTHLCLYNPDNKQYTMFYGSVRGVVAKAEQGDARPGLGYDAIFYFPPKKKLFSELSILEKNQFSHRGLAMNQTKIFIMKSLFPQRIIAALGLIVKNRHVLMSERRDFRPAFNGLWEFPGGGVEFGEDIENCLVREVKEETGYTVKIIERLPHIFSATKTNEKTGGYQIFPILFVCKIVSGTFKPAPAESLGHRWCTFQEMTKLKSFPLNKKILNDPLHKKIITAYID